MTTRQCAIPFSVLLDAVQVVARNCLGCCYRIVERDGIGPGAARTIWSGSFRKALLFAIGGKNSASLPARCGAPAAPACASLPPRRNKAQIIGAYGGRARHR